MELLQPTEGTVTIMDTKPRAQPDGSRRIWAALKILAGEGTIDDTNFTLYTSLHGHLIVCFNDD
ncbi:MAG: hypothetical protein KAJ19_19865, partial [Gammaproteobacteria bacterium]|nr:hypothetical protein [Gammaproteobacteria bacterium]